MGVYNNEDPVNLRFYMLSIWMNGSTGILLATPQILEDLRSSVFKKQARKHFKRDQFELVNMTSIIIIGLNYI